VETSPESDWNTDLFSETGQEKKEPSIPESPGWAADTNLPEEPERSIPVIHADEQPTSEEKPEKGNGVPETQSRATDSMPSSVSAPTRGIKPVTVFAITAMLVATIAVWLNPGAGDANNNTSALHETPAVSGTDIQIQRMEHRISSLEQQISQQNMTLKERVGILEKQLSSLKALVAKQAIAYRSKKQAMQHKASKPKSTVSPVSVKPDAGWVVNLMSLDSLPAAKKALADFKARGISAEIGHYSVKGKTRYRIRVAGFASKKEAEAQKEYLIRKHHIKAAWVNKP